MRPAAGFALRAVGLSFVAECKREGRFADLRRYRKGRADADLV